MLRGLPPLYLASIVSHRLLRYGSGLLHLVLLGTSVLLVPAGWTDPATAQCSMTPLTGIYGPHATASRLPFEGHATHLGRRVADLYTSHSPAYVEAVQRLLNERGWTDSAFDIYRCEIAYPILHTAVHLRVDGPTNK